MKTREPYRPKRPRPIVNSRPFAIFCLADNAKVSWPILTRNMVELLKPNK